MLFVLHLAAALFMTGLIWFVQIVHYPLFAGVGTREASAYFEAHRRLTTFVVGPPMLVEAITGVLLLFARPRWLDASTLATALALLLIVWLSTAALQVPQHGVLARGFDASAHRALVLSNWVRTFAWSVRSVLLLTALARALDTR